jgi:hypothetical protein
LIVKVLDFGLAKAIERTVTPEQREIAEEITSNLRLKLSGAEQGRVLGSQSCRSK